MNSTEVAVVLVLIGGIMALFVGFFWVLSKIFSEVK